MTHIWDMRGCLGDEECYRVMSEYTRANTLPEWRGVLLRVMYRVAELKRLEPIEQARHAAALADSYRRLDIVMSWYGRVAMPQWFSLLGDSWSVCDNISRWRSDLRIILRRATREELDFMMDAKEREFLAELPEHVTVYRGCYPINRAGLSWTMERSVAERFPTLNRYRRRDAQPLVRIGTVRRNRAVLKLDRGEQEVIAHDVRILKEEAINS